MAVMGEEKVPLLSDIGDEDIEPINGVKDFFREFSVESNKLWSMAAPAIFDLVFEYSLSSITLIFVGHLGTIELAAFSVQDMVIDGIYFGVMLGMGSALETLCGQAFGAGQLDMLGIYMQRSWVILNAMGLLLMFLSIFAAQVLRAIGQTPEISKAAGTLAVWMIPHIFAFAMNFPLSKFLQAQGKFMAMAVIAGVVMVLHILFNWIFIAKLGLGLAGAALVYNASWWFIVVAQCLYVLSGSCGRAWSGFSWKAFQNLGGFLKLSLASAVMLCVEFWYFTVLILFAGYLKNAEISVGALSICISILGWTVMVAFGFNAAVSVRVSNELGAGHPRTTKFSVVVVTITSFVVGLLLGLILIIVRNHYPALFSNSIEVQEIVYDLTPLLALSIVVNHVQPVLSGVAIGAGWQALVAYVNIGCYYLIGVPLGLLLGYKFDMGVRGLWYGMLSGTALQACILFWVIFRTDWEKEISIAGERIRKWGGETDALVHDEEE